jgi:hypothetical protein
MNTPFHITYGNLPVSFDAMLHMPLVYYLVILQSNTPFSTAAANTESQFKKAQFFT